MNRLPGIPALLGQATVAGCLVPDPPRLGKRCARLQCLLLPVEAGASRESAARGFVSPGPGADQSTSCRPGNTRLFPTGGPRPGPGGGAGSALLREAARPSGKGSLCRERKESRARGGNSGPCSRAAQGARARPAQPRGQDCAPGGALAQLWALRPAPSPNHWMPAPPLREATSSSGQPRLRHFPLAARRRKPRPRAP